VGDFPLYSNINYNLYYYIEFFRPSLIRLMTKMTNDENDGNDGEGKIQMKNTGENFGGVRINCVLANDRNLAIHYGKST